MAGAIYHNGQWYGLGGSEVLPNPQDSATDTLETVGIDGTVYEVTDADAVHTSDIGTANGVAELDSNGKVPSSQLPSFVDDVIEAYYDSDTDRFYEESTFTTVIPPTDGKSWVDVLTNKSYRWTGSVYVRVDEGVQLGETSSTAYRGDRGKTAYDHATESGRSGAKSAGLYKIGVTAQGHVASTSAVAKADLTALGVADQNDVDAIEEDIEGYKTVTGKYITVTDAAELPAESYSLTLSPVQDLNGYEYPWAAGAGVNKLNYDEWKGTGVERGTAVYENNGVTLTATSGDAYTQYYSNGNTNYFPQNARIPVSEGDTITLCWEETTNKSGVIYIMPNGQAITGMVAVNNSSAKKLQYTAGAGISYVTFRFGVTNANDTISYKNIQVVKGTTVPDRYYLYSNICPIHGADEVGVRVRGINLCDEEMELGGLDETTGQPFPNNNVIRTKNYIPCQAETNYYYYCGAGDLAFRICYYDSSKNFISSLAMTSINRVYQTPQNCAFIKFGMRDTYGTTYNHDISINYPSTDHDYHPYNGHSTTITLPSTVYGGSVEMGGSGESKYRFKTFDGTENWTWYSPSNSVLLSNGIDYRKGAGETIWVPGLCNIVKTGSSTGLLDDYIQAATISGYTLQVVQIGQHFNIENSVDAWKAFLQENNMQLCYEMATPTSLSLTPFPQTLLEGVNNLWAEMKENSVIIDNAQQSLSYQPQNIVGQLRQEINAKPDSFAQLSDVSFSNLSNGQIPKWNSASGKWENANESGGGGASSLAELSDTNISSPADGQILKWDGTTSKWVNANEYRYTLPTADANTLGGIKVGSRLSIDANGVLSANDQSYTLPTASASTKGGIKVGDNLSMNGEVLSAKLPQWTKVWNKDSGTTFVMPSGKTEIMLRIIETYYGNRSCLATTVNPLSYPLTEWLEVYWFTGDNEELCYGGINPSGVTHFYNYIPNYNFDFEIWVR